MSIRSTIVMAIIVAILGTLYVFRDKVKPADEDPEHPKVLSVKADDVAGLDLTSNGKPLTVDKGAGDVWLIQKPFKGLGASRDIQNFVNQLCEMKAERVVQDDVPKAGFKQFGLDKPTFVVKLRLKGSKDTPTIEFGNRAPSDTGYYTRVGDQDKVLLAGNTVMMNITKPLDGWREKAPLPVDSAKVDRIVASGEGIDLEVNKVKDKDEWTMEKPRKGKADAPSMSAWLMKLQGIQVTQFVDDVKGDDPRLKPTYTFQMWNKGERDPMTVVIGAHAGNGYYAMRTVDGESEVFMLPDAAKINFKVDAASLADKHMFDFDVDKVARVDLMQSDAGEASAQKKESTWEYTKPAAKKDDLAKVTTLLYALKALKYERKVTDRSELAKAQPGLKAPMARFELFDAAGKPIARVVVGGEAPQGRRYLLASGNDVYVADAGFANEWKANILAVKSAASPAPGPSGTPSAGALAPGPSASPAGAAARR